MPPRTIDVSVPRVFQPLWQKHARYKGAFGGRGSGKSHDRATHCVVEMLAGERVTEAAQQAARELLQG